MFLRFSKPTVLKAILCDLTGSLKIETGNANISAYRPLIACSKISTASPMFSGFKNVQGSEILLGFIKMLDF